MTTPPDFGGSEIEKGRLEEFGVGPDEHQAPGERRAPGEPGQDDLVQGDHEAHAPGQVCAACGAVIAPAQDVRRRADGSWVHEACPPTELRAP